MALSGSWLNSVRRKKGSTGLGDEPKNNEPLETLEAEIVRQERIFSLSGNNKGLMCPFKKSICLEGYCTECQIYLDRLKVRGKIKV